MVKLRTAYASAAIGWVLVALMLAAQGTRAEIVPDLYAVSIPVSEQSTPELQRAAAAGLRELAVRISGRSDAARNPALSGLLASAARYLDQYRYERNTGTDTPWLAQLRFAPGPIDNALRGAGLPVWGNNRPALQVWLAVDDGKSRNFVDDNSPVAGALREQLRHRGLLAHFPHDFSGVAIDDVWQLDAAKIQDAVKIQNGAAHERADALLIGRINQMPNANWQGSWALNVSGKQFNAEGEGVSLSAYLAPTIDRIVDSFSPQYAVAANSAAEGIVLRITGVTSFDDYAAIVNYLRHLSLIKSASP
ncbi:MAG TPA: DUF2066 domain-containing protein, partial [Spongiibacteraceae bacterium]